MVLQLWNQVLHLHLVTSYPVAPSSSRIVHLFYGRQTFFVFPFKSVRIFLGTAKLFVMSITLFFFSSFILPIWRWSVNFGTNSWLWILQNIAIHQSFVSFSKKPRNLNRHSHFLELVPWRFGFFLVLGGLYSPLLSHCIVKNDLFKLDLSIDIVNLVLAACRLTQQSKSSRPHHLSFVKIMRQCLLQYREPWQHR